VKIKGDQTINLIFILDFWIFNYQDDDGN